MALVRKVDERVKRKATRIVEAALAGAELNDDGTPVEPHRHMGEHGRPLDDRGKEWSGVRYRVAMDARKPLKQQPGYLAMAQRVLESYKRAEAAKEPAPELGADIRVYLTQNVFNYPTKDVSDRGGK